MNKLEIADLTNYVETHIGGFHQKRLEKLEKLDIKELLKRKNPYLFKAKNILTAQDLVRNLLDAYLQSQEETLFGDFMERVAIFICGQILGGIKSKIEGIDLEFERDGNYYIVEIKSGPNWGNSSQIKRMQDNFRNATAKLLAEKPTLKIEPVNGCCYGIDNQPDKGSYYKYCGQEFWTLISGQTDLYIQIIEPLGHRAKDRNEEFLRAYAKVINRFSQKFMEDFCVDGEINWGKLVEFNSKKKLK